MSDGRVIIQSALDNSELEKDWMSAQGLLTKGSKICKDALAGITLAAVTTSVVNLGAAFESSMAKASTLFGDVAVDTVNLNSDMLELSSTAGKAAEELGEGLYTAPSAGVDVTKDMGGAMDFMTSATKLSVSGFTDVDTAVSATAKVLNAYNMGLDETDRVHKVLMQTQNKGITTVDELGSVLSQVTPTAAAFKVSFETVSAALATMTAQGTSTAQATTQLNQLIAELGKEGTQAQKGLSAATKGTEYAGMSFKQMMEAGVPLNEVLDIMAEYAENNEKNLLDMFSSIEAGKAALAVAGDNSAKFNENLRAMSTESDVVGDAYAKMSDTLSFKGNQIKESAKNVGIAFYQSMQEPMKEGADVAIQALDGISDAIPRVTKAFKPAGTAALFLVDNMETIAPIVAVSVAALGAFKILTTIQKWYKTNAAASIAYAAAMSTSTMGVETCSVAHVLLASTMSATELIIGVLTGKVKLATAAQVAWNAVLSANPIGLAVAGVAALTAGIIALNKVIGEDVTEQYLMSESQEKNLESCKNSTAAINEQRQAHEDAVASIEREYNGYSSLLTELQSITDANGNVKAGYEDRAKVITGQLSDALGVEIELLDGQIQKYDEVVSSIKEVIVQKKAEALASSMEADMANAYEKSSQAVEDYKNAQEALEEQQKKVAAAEEAYRKGGPAQKKILDEAKAQQTELEEALQKSKTAMQDLSTEVNNYDALMEAMASGDVAQIEAAMSALVTAYQSFTKETLSSSKEARQEMYDQAQGYVENMKLVQDGTVQVADSVYTEMARAAASTIENFNELPGGVAEGIEAIGPEASSAMIGALAQANLDGKLDAEAKKDVESFISGLDGLDEKSKETFAEAWYGALEGLEGFEELADPAKEGADAFLESLAKALEVHSPSRAVKKIFSNVWPGAQEGLGEGAEELNTSGQTVISSFLQSLSSGGLLEGAQNIGVSIMQAFGIGVGSQAENSYGAGAANATAAGQGAGSVNPSGIGVLFGNLLSGGISGMSSVLNIAGKSIASSARTGAGSVNPGATGKTFGSLFGGGIRGMAGVLLAAGSGIANSARSGASAVDSSAAGRSFGTVFGNAISATSRASRASGKSIAASAKEGSSSVSSYSVGSDFGSGFVSGIGSWLGAAARKGAELARSAIEAVRNTQKSSSPSKVTRGLGHDFDAGYAGGIEDGVKEAEKSAEVMTERVMDQLASARLSFPAVDLSAIDCSSVIARLKHSMVTDNIAMGASIAANVTHNVTTETKNRNSSVDVAAKRFAEYFIEAFKRSGLAIVMDDTEVARLKEGVFAI